MRAHLIPRLTESALAAPPLVPPSTACELFQFDAGETGTLLEVKAAASEAPTPAAALQLLRLLEPASEAERLVSRER